ncbi:putative leader peptide [Streptomyces maoxianensis]|uniref:Leader peptide n=1 Tax=Streptomyces maoxianensis TaxID=1459942 RepID=A0ABV9G2N5_9ACTN
MRDDFRGALTWPEVTAILCGVSQADILVSRLHVDLRRHASALCAAGR